MNNILLPNRSFVISKNFVVKMLILLFSIVSFLMAMTLPFSKIYYTSTFDNYITETAVNYLFMNSQIVTSEFGWGEFAIGTIVIFYMIGFFFSVVLNLKAIEEDNEKLLLYSCLIDFGVNLAFFTTAVVMYIMNKATYTDAYYSDKSFSTSMYIPFLISACSLLIYLYHKKKYKDINVRDVGITVDETMKDENINLTVLNISHVKIICTVIMTAGLLAFNILLPYIVSVRTVEFFHIEYIETVKDNFVNFILFRSNLIEGNLGVAVVSIVYWLNLIAILAAAYLYRTALKQHSPRFAHIASLITLVFNLLVFASAIVVVLLISGDNEKSITLSFIPALLSVICLMFVRNIKTL